MADLNAKENDKKTIKEYEKQLSELKKTPWYIGRDGMPNPFTNLLYYRTIRKLLLKRKIKQAKKINISLSALLGLK